MEQWKGDYTHKLHKATKALLNREEFSYNMNTDALYNMYKNQYMQQGNYDMRNAIGEGASQTGGYASSAAVAAGNSAYQSNMSALNDKAMETYQFALNQYNSQTDELNRRWNLYNTLDQQQYQMHRDQIADEFSDREYQLQRAKYGL